MLPPLGQLRWSPVVSAAHGGAGGPGLIDLSASLNPLGPSPAALAAARGADLERYPEADAQSLTLAVARRFGIDPAMVVPVPGASWGLWLVLASMVTPGQRTLVVTPCFGEYERYLRIFRAQITRLRCSPESNFEFPLRALELELGRAPALVMLANPSNPQGTTCDRRVLRALVLAHPDSTFVVDEAFAAFASGETSLMDQPLPPNLAVVRSLTKELGLAGLRMGFLVCPDRIARDLRATLPPWPISSPSLAAAIAGLEDNEHTRRGAALARAQLREFGRLLQARGGRPFPSEVNFMLVQAAGLHQHLRAAGILTRDCASFGLEGWIRMAAAPPVCVERVRSAIELWTAQ